MKKKFKLTLVRGLRGCTETQRLTIKTLGLRKRHHSVVVNDSPAMRGQIMKVQHLIELTVEKA